jgi:putative addiction module component (TIGR02574 family)
MTLDQITADALALPIVDRIKLVQELWKSVDHGQADSDEKIILNEVIQRQMELSQGKIAPIRHKNVMDSANSQLE